MYSQSSVDKDIIFSFRALGVGGRVQAEETDFFLEI